MSLAAAAARFIAQHWRLSVALLVAAALLVQTERLEDAEQALTDHIAADERAAKDAALHAAQTTVRELADYVDRIARMETSISTVRTRLDRVCSPQAAAPAVLDPTGRAADRGPDPADRADHNQREQLAAELLACRRNTERLSAIARGFRR